MSRPHAVTFVAEWSGWCTPCQSEDRPLVLTRSGPGGVRSWLAGLGDDDRLLLLTCRLCGDWQVVPPREQDDPEVVLVDEVEDVVAVSVVDPVVEPVAVPVVASVAVPVVESVVGPVAEPAAEDVTPAAARFAGALRALAEQRTAELVPVPRRPVLRVLTYGGGVTSLVLPDAEPVAVAG